MKLWLAYFMCVGAINMKAQQASDTLWVKEVVKVEKLSTDKQMQSGFTDIKYQQGKELSEVLGEFSSVYVKSYGSGQLASLAVQGTSATQSVIQWNGIQLNSPALGQTDLSLFVVGMQDEIRLMKTGFEGTIGGTLQLVDHTAIDSGVAADVTLRGGSFNTFQFLGSLKYGKEKVSGATRFSYLRSDNNFLFRNTFKEGQPLERQTNAKVRLLSFMQQLNVKLNSSNELNFYGWLNEAQREIPPIIGNSDGHEKQGDYSLRVMANWKGTFRQLHTHLTSAYLQDYIRYQNPETDLDETTLTTAVRNKFQFTYVFPFSWSLNGAVNYDYEQANVEEYQKLQHRHTVGFKLYTDYYHSSGTKFHAGFREDLVGKQLSAFAPELEISYAKRWQQTHEFGAGLKVSRNFRFPTFNDLYWTPGGNPNLKQEKSWNGELDFRYSCKKYFSLSVSNFYVYVQDWIQWIPDGSLWSPVNFRRVFSRGVEINLKSSTTDNPSPDKLMANFFVSYTYTKATNLDASFKFDQSAGKQLIYVPEHSLTGGVELRYKRFYLSSINNIVSRLFTSTDNSQFLKGYYLSHLEAGKDFLIGRNEIGLSFRVKNIGNSHYQSVAQRPMPGRSFEGVLRFNIK